MVPPLFAAGPWTDDLHPDAASVEDYALSSANGALSVPAYLRRRRLSVGNSQVHSASGEAPAHTCPGSLSPPGRVLVLVNVFDLCGDYTARFPNRQLVCT